MKDSSYILWTSLKNNFQPQIYTKYPCCWKINYTFCELFLCFESVQWPAWCLWLIKIKLLLVVLRLYSLQLLLSRYRHFHHSFCFQTSLISNHRSDALVSACPFFSLFSGFWWHHQSSVILTNLPGVTHCPWLPTPFLPSRVPEMLWECRSPRLSLCDLNKSLLCTVGSLCPGWPLSMYIVACLQSCLFSLPSLFLTWVDSDPNWQTYFKEVTTTKEKLFFFFSKSYKEAIFTFFLISVYRNIYVFMVMLLLFFCDLACSWTITFIPVFVWISVTRVSSNMFSENHSVWAISGLVII